MIRMTLALSLAIYLGLVVWGDPATQATALPARLDTDAAVVAAIASASGPDRPVILADEQASAPQVGRAAVSRVVVPAAASIAASASDVALRAIGEPTLVSLVETMRPDASGGLRADATPPPTGPLLRVSGDRVNMRSGPSTADSVVESLPLGTLAEPLGEVSGGWVEIRVIDTGITGFMAASFLDPA